MKNVIVIVIDALSKWYIDQYKTGTDFFSMLEKKSLCFNNMFSGAPFTEGALHEMWASENTIAGMINPAERRFDNDPVHLLFKKNGYYFYADPLFRMNMNGHVAPDNWTDKERKFTEARSVARLMAVKITYYSNLKKKGIFREGDYWKVIALLDDYFAYDWGEDKFRIEKDNFEKDKRIYIDDLLDNHLKSSFFINLVDENVFEAKRYPFTNVFNKIDVESLSDIEKKFVVEAKYKNLEFLYKNSLKMSPDDSSYMEMVLAYGITDRCLLTNSDLLYTLYDAYDKVSTLKNSFEQFWDWYDKREDVSPFFAYIHNADFHYPASFMDTRYTEGEAFIEELSSKREEVRNLTWKKMSVAKQLSLANIEKNLKRFWEELEKRGVFKDTYVVLTADHGITNYMYKDIKAMNRWNYTKTNFQVPFYMQGCDIISEICENLCTAKDIIPILADKCGLDTFENKYIGNCKCQSGAGLEEVIEAAWMNGEPDLDRSVVKMGIRNKKYSLTCEGFITQFGATTSICGLYDLENDPDECHDIQKKIYSNEKLASFLEKFNEKWFEMTFSILTDKEGIWDFVNKYKISQNEKEHYASINSKLKKMTWNDLKERVSGCNIIIWGCAQEAKRFISDPNFVYPVSEYWTTEDYCTYFMGVEINRPRRLLENEKTVIIITHREEIVAIKQLEELGIDNYVFSRLIK